MRTYFFGDIHGNVDALDVCLRRLEEQKADEVYCLGDLAGWLPFGDRTFARLRSTGFPTVAGNHEAGTRQAGMAGMAGNGVKSPFDEIKQSSTSTSTSTSTSNQAMGSSLRLTRLNSQTET
jgi:predicted phosphodiesterase